MSKNKKSQEYVAGIVIGIFILVIGVVGAKRHIDMKNWLAVKGVVVSAEIVERVGESRTGTKISKSCFVSYKYSVNLTEYDLTESVAGVCKYSEGEEVTLYYNPQNLGDSVLIRDQFPMSYVLIVFGSLVFVISFLIKFFNRTR
jgi:uncharacterized protein DUF3592